MGIDVTSLSIKVTSEGIEKAADALERLVVASDKVDKSSKTTVKSTQAADSAQQSAIAGIEKYLQKLNDKVNLLGKSAEYSSKYTAASKTQDTALIAIAGTLGRSIDLYNQKNIQQQRDIELTNQQARAYAAAQSEAIKMNAAMDSSALKNKAISQQRDIDLHNMQGKAYAATQAEALKMNKAYDAQSEALKTTSEHGSIFNNTLKSMAVAAIAYLGVGFVKGIIEAADAWQMMQSKLKLATGSMETAKVAQQDLYALAQSLRVPLEDVAKLYTRMSIPMEKLGKSSRDTMAMVEGVSLALKLGGATGAEAASVMLQYSQSINAGRLNGAEFNAVAEAAPSILRAIETELRRTGDWGSKTTDTLKKLGAEGKISVDLMQKSMENALRQWRKDFDDLPMTVDGSVTLITNAWRKMLGETNIVTGGVGALATGLTEVSLFITDLTATAKLLSAEFGETTRNADGLSNTAMVLGTIFETLLITGANVAFVMRGIGSEIGGIAAQIVALAHFDLKGFSAISAAMKEDADKARKELDAFEARILGMTDRVDAKKKQTTAAMELSKTVNDDAEFNKFRRQQESGTAYIEEQTKALKKASIAWDELHRTKDTKKQDEIKAIEQFKVNAEDYAKKLANIEERYKTSNAAAKKLTHEQQQNNTVIDQSISKYKEYVAEYDKLIESGDKRLKSEKWLTQAQSELNAMLTDSTGRFSKYDIQAARYKVSVAEAAVQVERMTVAEQENIRVQEEKVKAAEKAQEVTTKEIEKLVEHNQKLKDQVDTFGMTEGAIQDLMAVREESILLTMQEEGYSTVAIHNQQQKINLLREEGTLRGELAKLNTDKETADKATAEWKKTVEKYEDIFSKGFLDMLARGKGDWDSFSKSIVTTFKTTVADQLYKMFIKPIVIQLIGSLTGGIGNVGGSSTGAGGSGSILDALSSSKSSYESAYTNFAQGSFGEKLGLSSGTSEYTGPWAGNAAGGTGTTMTSAGQFVGDALPYLPAISSAIEGSWGKAAGQALGAYLGGPIGSAIGGFLGDLADKFFSGGGPESHTTLSFGSSANAVTSSTDTGRNQANGNYVGGAGVNTAFGSYGVTDQFWMDSIASANKPALDAFLAGVKSSDDMLASYLTSDERAKVISALNNKTTVLQTGAEGSDPSTQYSKAYVERIQQIFEGIDTGMSKFITGFTGTAEQLNAEATAILAARANIDKYAQVFGETVSLDSLNSLRQGTENLSTAITRLVTTFQLTNSIAALLGKDMNTAFGAVGLASDTARERLVNLAGGLNNLETSATFFAQNFYSEAERLKPVAASVNKALADMGLAGVDTRAEFRAVIEGLDLATEADAKRYTQLMALAPAFAQVYAAEEAVTAATPDVVTSINDILTAYKDASKAYDTAKNDVATANKAISDSLVSLGDTLAGFANAVTESDKGVTSARDNISTAYFAAQDAVAAAQQNIVDISVKAAAAMKEFSNNIGDFLSSLNTTTAGSGSPESRLAALKDQFNSVSSAAMNGDSSAQGQLLSVAKDFLSASKDYNATGTGFTADESFVKSILQQTQTSVTSGGLPSAYSAEMAQAQTALATAQAQLDEITALAKTTGASTERNTFSTSENTRALLSAYNSAVSAQAVAQANYQQALTLTKGMALTTSDSLTGLRAGIDAYNKSIGDLATAATALAAAAANKASTGSVAVTAASGAIDTTAGAAVMDMYKNIAGRSEADAAGFAYWLDVYNTQGATATRAGFQDAVNQINGSHKNGLDRVPFDGYVAELHKGEQVKTAAAVTSSEEAEAQMVTLTAEILQRMSAIEMHTSAANNQRAAVSEVLVDRIDNLASKQEATTRKIATL